MNGRLCRARKRNRCLSFQSEDEEREFWADHDSTEFIDWQSAERSKFANLKPTLRTISLRLPVSIIEDLKVLANRRDVPYRSLLKVFLAERLKEGAPAGIATTNFRLRVTEALDPLTGDALLHMHVFDLR